MAAIADRVLALRLFDLADELRPYISDSCGAISTFKLLEVFLPCRLHEFVFHVEARLSDERGQRIHGKTTFMPHPQITMEELAYEQSLDLFPPAVFTALHEGFHVMHHKDDPRAKKVVELNRGMPKSGTSFRETPELELEANFFAGAVVVPRSFVTKKTTVDDVIRNFPASLETAERALRQIRAVHPEKWSPSWNRRY